MWYSINILLCHFQKLFNLFSKYRGADKSLARPGRKQARKHVRDERDFNNIETQGVIKLFFLQGKSPKEIHPILTETVACFLPGRAKDLSASLFVWCWVTHICVNNFIFIRERKQKCYEIPWWTNTDLASVTNVTAIQTWNLTLISQAQKRCQFLQNIVIRSEISEQNLNGYCDVDFVFRLGSNKCLVYLWH